MAETIARVREMVTSELKKNPNTTNRELHEKVAAVDESIRGLDLRQFNARYTLPAKSGLGLVRRGGRRRKAAPADGGPTPAAPRARGRRGRPGKVRETVPTDRRQAIERVLLHAVRDAAKAQSVGDFLGGLDKYIDEIEAALGSG